MSLLVSDAVEELIVNIFGELESTCARCEYGFCRLIYLSCAMLLVVAAAPHSLLGQASAIELPANTGCVSYQLYFRGWAFDPAHLIRSVHVAIDSVNQGEASYGASRPDICGADGAKYPTAPGCPNVGWSAVLPTPQAGTHTITATSINIVGQSQVATLSLTVPAFSQTTVADVWASGWEIATLSGIEQLTGTAYFSNTSPSITVSTDGNLVGSAKVTPQQGQAGYYNWTFSLNTAMLTNGPHTLTLSGTQSNPTYCSSAPVSIRVLNPAGSGALASKSPAKQYIYLDGHVAAIVNGAH